MDISKYEVFLKVIERGGFNQASEELGYSRSALSKIINSIEKVDGAADIFLDRLCSDTKKSPHPPL